MKYIDEIDVKGKKVIVRVDYNVPIKDGIIEDDNRIKKSLTTINYLLENNAKIILLSHLGKIKTEEDKQKNSLKVVSEHLGKLLNMNIIFSEETRGKKLDELVNNMKEKDIILVENTRYEDVSNKLESNCDENLSKYWASLGDIFVLDAFASAHRNHASTYGIAKYIKGYAGFLIKEELNVLKEVFQNKNKDILLGGAKVEDKIGVITNLIQNSNSVLLGGAMCFTFLKAKGYNVGLSFVDEERLKYAKELIEKYPNKIILPIDIVTENEVKDIDKISNNDIGYDIGPKTIEKYKEILSKSNLVVWNGPLGWFENEKYAKGTKDILYYLHDNNIKTVIAGGDTGNAANQYGLKFFYISTGGGATLEYLEGKEFQTLEVLEK
jgi:phosphoglycerate kinase